MGLPQNSLIYVTSFFKPALSTLKNVLRLGFITSLVGGKKKRKESMNYIRIIFVSVLKNKVNSLCNLQTFF